MGAVGALWAGVVAVAVAVGVVGAVVVARDGVGGPSLSLSLREEDEGRRKSEAKRLCLAAGVCVCCIGISTCRVFGDGSWETGGMAARCWCAGEFAGSCRVQRCSITKSI